MVKPHDRHYARLFAETRAALHRYACRFVGSAQTADEIVQEAFLRTYQQGDKLLSPKAFLYKTARNIAANINRHERIAKTELVGDFDDLSVSLNAQSLESEALDEERHRLIQEAVERLPLHCRAAFALRIFFGCSYKEIADRLGISPKTVEKHVAHGLRESHRYLKQRYTVRDRKYG